MKQKLVEHPVEVFRATEKQLEKLGYLLAWQSTGNADIIIEDYPRRPITDFFQLRYITPPVGYANPAVTERAAHYYFQSPRIFGPDLAGTDIRAGLRELERGLNTFAEQHQMVVGDRVLLPLLQVLQGDVERCRRCLEAKIHPKWLADMLAFGIEFEEALELKDVPSRQIYQLYYA